MSSGKVLAWRRPQWIGRPNMQTCISVYRQGNLFGMDTPPETHWIAAINRLLRAKLRADPAAPHTLIWWNQGDLARAAGVRENTLSDLLKGKREPSVSTLAKLAQALDVPTCCLLMTEADATTFLRARMDKAQETHTHAVRQDLRERMQVRLEGLLQELQTAARDDATIAAPVPETPRKRKRA